MGKPAGIAIRIWRTIQPAKSLAIPSDNGMYKLYTRVWLPELEKPGMGALVGTVVGYWDNSSLQVNLDHGYYSSELNLFVYCITVPREICKLVF